MTRPMYWPTYNSGSANNQPEHRTQEPDTAQEVSGGEKEVRRKHPQVGHSELTVAEKRQGHVGNTRRAPSSTAQGGPAGHPPHKMHQLDTQDVTQWDVPAGHSGCPPMREHQCIPQDSIQRIRPLDTSECHPLGHKSGTPWNIRPARHITVHFRMPPSRAQERHTLGIHLAGHTSRTTQQIIEVTPAGRLRMSPSRAHWLDTTGHLALRAHQLSARQHPPRKTRKLDT